MEKYYYSEGFIYLNNKIICELYGTDTEKKEKGIEISKLLNNRTTNILLYYSFGLLTCLIICCILALS